ncbi:tetrahydrofolate dehydrogenase/cyclohydrolase catalytic domain-containing protein [Scytonema sp. UIC 10036]|uniref:tetrahydrofolate dehydrogenase/cyclohydrolase catalytic domain-containing protein n=1 Tax=Scytonema sp. UIC 10036 TaxID=2304196 RepID=UPI001FAA98FD|nr:tetrahydrofolate dehydrogenase/cyclohydrolase catalytic domain-containing protein [Scytonema sp. UIC 10036]
MIIDGNIIKEHVKNQCKNYQEQLLGKEITIIRFNPPANLRVSENLSERQKSLKGKYEAALVSENQKLATFESFGVKVTRQTLSPEDTTVEQFQSLLRNINDNENVKAAIVQFPIPSEFEDSLEILSPEKDIDIVREEPNGLFSVPATSEGVAFVESFAQPDSNIAVIGGGGFIGNGVVNYLREKNINCFILEDGDDLSRTRVADIVVTVTGVPGLATPYILPQHRLVVDSGFTPGETKQDRTRGDVDKSAYNIPQNITPVPGGIGPTEMAILAERFIKMELGIELPKLNYQQLAQERLERAQIITPLAKDILATTNNNDISRPPAEKSELFVLELGDYKLTLDTEKNIFMVSRLQEKTLLIQENLTTGV